MVCSPPGAIWPPLNWDCLEALIADFADRIEEIIPWMECFPACAQQDWEPDMGYTGESLTMADHFGSRI
jgi:hypothetical protein